MPTNPITKVESHGRECTICHEFKLWDGFTKSIGHRLGYRPQCKTCTSNQAKKYYINNKDAVLAKGRAVNKTEHRRSYVRKYQRERFRKINESLASRPRPEACEICGDVGDCKGIVFDHDHMTGKFRGWLCNRCNRVIGMVKDSSVTLKQMVQYLEESCR